MTAELTQSGVGRGKSKNCKGICANLLSEDVCSQHSKEIAEPYQFNGIKYRGSIKPLLFSVIALRNLTKQLVMYKWD